MFVLFVGACRMRAPLAGATADYSKTTRVAAALTGASADCRRLKVNINPCNLLFAGLRFCNDDPPKGLVWGD